MPSLFYRKPIRFIFNQSLMFKFSLIISFLAYTMSPLFAQTPCMPNDTVTTVVYPAPELDSMGGIRTIACKGKPFDFTWTFNIPPTFTTNGLTANLDSVVIATTGAVSNLPADLTYSCNPPNCIFKANLKGCIGITGVVSPSAPVGDLELKIAVLLYGKIFGAPLTAPFNIPDPALTGNGKYILRVRESSDPLCSVGTRDPFAAISDIKMSPVPATNTLRVDLDVQEQGEYQLHIINAQGQLVNSSILTMSVGANVTEIDVTTLPSGNFQLLILKDGQFTARRFVVTK